MEWPNSASTRYCCCSGHYFYDVARTRIAQNKMKPKYISKSQSELRSAGKPSGPSLTLGTPTDDEAREKFRSVFSRWIEILATEMKEAAN
jgi:hypothetical protein